MAVEIIMPKLGMSMEEGTVVEWLKKEGDAIKKGESIAVISSEKIEKDIEAPQDGVLLKIIAAQDETVAVGQAIGYIGQEGESMNEAERREAAKKEEQVISTASQTARQEAATAIAAEETKTASQMMARVSPAARKLAREAGIDLSKISGSGPKGRITRADIEKAIQMAQAPAPSVAEKQPKPQTNVEVEPSGVTVKPMTGMRKTIASRMFASLQQTAQLTIHMNADVTHLLEMQEKMRLDEAIGKLTITDFIARAVVLSLLQHKQINSHYQNGQIQTYDAVHLGIAVALENGLVVPVVKHAESLSLREISQQIKTLSKKAREGALNSEEMTGSTFTITSLGAYGVEFFTPVLNPPEVGILGVGTATDVPVFIGEDIQRRKRLPLSLTFDHQIIDGAPASDFLRTVKTYLEAPYRLLWLS
ncbi:branched-chain alpha-keto acid dehydrogenase subunit E2 [Anoxybacillus sp. UARK-01]|uniref:Dihydrolipoamide acetyltransferase component of pyruvate dehydrogenase complex n=1 Tax=Anoxybacteroides rupiense TaxID=311460 RepID=A0ABD5IR45_9BACL|nr:MULTISPECIES: dihydrolipoamide acetyltransferase family protein [Anoxybacillus]MED5050748.1 dihydrolipoamide acetyltransferase family protein [Anoxybacillus rupiensis]OQM47359.1 branched-chain alpha-keto acid dehydrogenase subunit E2 [Anoxybacillus sp. UARK-01]